MIKYYNDFINESKEKSGKLYDFGCVMLYPKIDDWKNIISMINEEDVYKPEDKTYGIEKSPHITLLYGLHKDVSKEDVKDAIDKFKGKEISIKVDGVGIFENEEFDVVKLNIIGNLDDINKELCKLPHTNDYPDYKPHMTISYVNKGTSKKYIDKNFRFNIDFVKEIKYKMTTGETAIYHL